MTDSAIFVIAFLMACVVAVAVLNLVTKGREEGVSREVAELREEVNTLLKEIRGLREEIRELRRELTEEP